MLNNHDDPKEETGENKKLLAMLAIKQLVFKARKANEIRKIHQLEVAEEIDETESQRPIRKDGQELQVKRIEEEADEVILDYRPQTNNPCKAEKVSG